MRTPVIAGNWKMYKTAEEAAAFVREFLPLVVGLGGVEIVLAPAFPSLAAVAALTRGTNVGVASQNLHFAEEGAYTGEVSPRMVRDTGAGYAIVGHSEGRQLFAENDDPVDRKARAVRRCRSRPRRRSSWRTSPSGQSARGRRRRPGRPRRSTPSSVLH